VHNSEKKAFKNGGFFNVIKLLDNVKYDIFTSPGKLGDHLDCCKIAGDNPVIQHLSAPQDFLIVMKQFRTGLII
jgi:hypothetical protein